MVNYLCSPEATSPILFYPLDLFSFSNPAHWCLTRPKCLPPHSTLSSPIHVFFFLLHPHDTLPLCRAAVSLRHNEPLATSTSPPLKAPNSSVSPPRCHSTYQNGCHEDDWRRPLTHFLVLLPHHPGPIKGSPDLGHLPQTMKTHLSPFRLGRHRTPTNTNGCRPFVTIGSCGIISLFI
jgi:hypothetical protein